MLYHGKIFAVHFFVGRITLAILLILLPFVAVIKSLSLPWLFVKAVAIERWHKQRLRYWCQDIFYQTHRAEWLSTQSILLLGLY